MKIKYGVGLNNTELEQLCKDYDVKINGIYSKDELPTNLKQGWYIINLQSANEGDGTHWLAFCFNDNNPCMYFDSFGFLPPQEILEVISNNYLSSHKQLQDEASKSCGFWCIACIKESEKFYGNNNFGFKRFLYLFSNNTLLNEQKLKSLFILYNTDYY